MHGYERDYRRPRRPWRYDESYDQGYRAVGGGPGAGGRCPAGSRPSIPGGARSRFPRDMWHDTAEFDRAPRGEAGPRRPAPGVNRYDRAYRRGYAQRFRRPPEGAELREFRREEMGRLRDR